LSFEVIRKKNLYEEIVTQIIRYIQEKNIKPGDKLPSENELVDIFKVSKTAVREAPGGWQYFERINGQYVYRTDY
jgi:GntR family transcriptional repressor for pyruvate dehydrogenase complex